MVLGCQLIERATKQAFASAVVLDDDHRPYVQIQLDWVGLPRPRIGWYHFIPAQVLVPEFGDHAWEELLDWTIRL